MRRNETKVIEAEDCEDGVRRPVKMTDPAMPPEAERREHELTHVPYCSWCKHCV